MYKEKKISYIKQLYPSECGLCCAVMILRYYGIKETADNLRSEFDCNRDGLSMIQIKRILEQHGMSAKAYRAELDVIENTDCPAILYWENKHFVILQKITEKEVILADPAVGIISMSKSEAKEKYSSYVLLSRPLKKRKRSSGFKNREILKACAEKKKLVFWGLLIALITNFAVLHIYIQLKCQLERLIQYDGSRTCVIRFGIGMLLDAGILMGMLFARRKLEDKILRNNTEDTLRMMNENIYAQEYEYYETMSEQQILGKIKQVQAEDKWLTGGFAECQVHIIAILVFAIYLHTLSLRLAFVSCVYVFVSFTITTICKKQDRNSNRKNILEATNMAKVQNTIFSNMVNLKIAGCETGYFEDYKESAQKVAKVKRQVGKYQLIYTMARGAVDRFGMPLVLFLGFLERSQGRMMAGEIVAFCLSFQTIVLHYMKLLDFMETNQIPDLKTEKKESTKSDKDTKEYKQISGAITVSNVSYFYPGKAEYILKNISLDINAGEKVVITGSSGSGKTTLGKVLAGLYHPVEGELYYDGTNVEILDTFSLRNQLGVVNDYVTLMNESIYENIRMNRKAVSKDMVEEVVRVSGLAEEIDRLPLKYNTIIREDGAGFSKGFCQKLLVARALCNHPKIVLFDECMTAVDIALQEKISMWLKEKGCTQIVITNSNGNRKDSDKIFVMENGEMHRRN